MMKEKQCGEIFSKGRSIGLGVALLIALLHAVLYISINSYPAGMENVDDQGAFLRIAMNISKDCSFSASAVDEKEFCVTRPPLYPVLIGTVWRLTGSSNIWIIQWGQLVAILLIISLQSKTAFLLSGSRSYGVWVACVMSVIPHIFATASLILTECLTLLLITINAYLMARLKESHIRHLLFLGIASGLIALQRPTFFYLPFFLVLLMPLYGKTGVLKRAIVYLTVYFVVLLPWGICNYVNTGVFSLTRAAGLGYNSILGIIKVDNGISEDWVNRIVMLSEREAHHEKINYPRLSPDDVKGAIHENEWIMRALAVYIDSWSLHPPPPENVITADKFLKDAALRWAEHNPRRVVTVLASNVKKLTFGRYNPLIYQDLGRWYNLVFDSVRYGLYLLFFLGLVKGVREGMYRLIMLPVVVICYLISVHMFFQAEPRYFLYAYVFMPLPLPLLWSRKALVNT